MSTQKPMIWWYMVVVTIGLLVALRQPKTVTALYSFQQGAENATPTVTAQSAALRSSAIYLPLIQNADKPTGTGQGDFTLQIHVIGQGIPHVSPTQSFYSAGQTVTLSVIAVAGWQFHDWSGDLTGSDNPTTIIMNSNHVVMANFIEPSADSTPTMLPSPTTIAPAAPTATFTPTKMPTALPTHTVVAPANTPTNTSTNTPTDTPTAAPTSTPTNTPTATPTNTPTNTLTDIPTITVTYTPTPMNQPPVVNVGAAQTTTWPAAAKLNGTVSDDGLPNGQLTISWQKVTGPGTVTFTPADQPNTTASFSATGDYVLILIADDGALNGSALVAIRVNGTPPAAPSNVQVAALDATTLYISWTDNADNEDGFTVDEGSTSFEIGRGSIAFTHGGLAPNSYHCYTISAFNSYGRSAATDWVCATTLPAPIQIESLNVRGRFEQRDANADRLQDVPFQVTIKNAAGTQTLYQTSGWVFPLSLTDGNYGTAVLQPSNPNLIYDQPYQIFVRGAMHLTRKINITLTEGMRLDLTDPAINPAGPLLGCDINQDNQVDLADHDLWAAAVQAGAQPPTTPDPASSTYRSDVNGDHVIDISDFSICTANMGKVGD